MAVRQELSKQHRQLLSDGSKIYNAQGQCLCLRSYIPSVSEALSPGDLHALVSICTYTSKFQIHRLSQDI